MRKTTFFFILLFPLFVNILFAQNSNCTLVGTKWGIKNVEIKRTTGSIEDSIRKVRLYQKFDSVELNFYTKNKVIVSCRQYRILGKYKIKQTVDEKVLVFTKWYNFGFYENGSLERSEFAVFLYPFKSRDIPFLKDCSFMILSKLGGVNSEIFYKKIE